MRERAYLGRDCMWGALVRRAWVAGAGATPWVRGVGTCCRGWAASVGRVEPMSGRCVGRRVGGLSAQCLPPVRGSVRVDAWAGAPCGGSFRAVAPVAISGILLLVCGGRVSCGNVPNNAYDQGGQELVASAGACLACSLVGARFRPLPAPPARLSESAPFACHIPRIFRFQVLYVKAFFASCPVSLCVNTSVYSEH